MLKNKKIGVGISGSFCSLKKLFFVLDELKQEEADLYLIVTEEIQTFDTRFYSSQQLLKDLQTYTSHPLITTIVEAELFGPKIPLDLMLVMPASANTMAKMAHGICDNPVIMACKATLRNLNPVVISFYTNDALGNSGKNIMQLINTKGFYFVPFGQDDYLHKPKSMVSDHTKVIDTMTQALLGKQLQPMVVTYNEL